MIFELIRNCSNEAFPHKAHTHILDLYRILNQLRFAGSGTFRESIWFLKDLYFYTYKFLERYALPESPKIITTRSVGCNFCAYIEPAQATAPLLGPARIPYL